jgi:hypothetical protein
MPTLDHAAAPLVTCPAGLLSCREATRRTFTLQDLAGHDNIKATIRYVYPQVTPSTNSLPGEKLVVLSAILKARQLLSAEVVKLADTPS